MLYTNQSHTTKAIDKFKFENRDELRGELSASKINQTPS